MAVVADTQGKRSNDWPEHDSADGASGWLNRPEHPLRPSKLRLRTPRFWLACLSLTCVLSIGFIVGLLVYYSYQQTRRALESSMLETARALSMVVDQQITAMQASATALATSPSLVSGDLAAFHRQAQAVVHDYPNSTISLSDATGQQLVNTFVPFGTPLPKRAGLDAVQRVFETGKPVITNLFKGALTGRFTVGVDVPVFLGERVAYDLALNIPAQRFEAIFSEQRIPTEWPSAIIDANLTVVARNRLQEKFVGTKIFPDFIKRLAEAAEGFGEFRSKEGFAVVGPWSRSTKTGWIIFIGVPKAVFVASVWRSLKWVVFGVILLSIAAVTLALFLTKRIAASIAERKRAEEALRNSARLYRAIGESINYGIWMCAPDGRNTYASESFLKLVGMTQQQCSDFGWGEVLHPDDAERTIAAWKECVRTGGIWDVEHRFRGVDGQWHPILARGVPVRDDQGQIICWAGINLDMSSVRQTEAALLRSEKLASVGRMAATMAHEINNPLEAVTNTLFLAKGTENLPKSAHQYLEMADEELKRIAHITRQSLGFYRESNAPALMSVNATLESAVDLLKNRIKAKGAVIERQWDGEMVVTAVAGELRQVFSNLLANSLDAIDAKGTIKLRVSAGAAVNNGDRCVRVTVADDGKGIDPSSRQRLFEPFFTTKGTVGTGLGLWVSKEIISKHGGIIRVRSSAGGTRRGTTFSIMLPVEPAVRSQSAGHS